MIIPILYKGTLKLRATCPDPWGLPHRGPLLQTPGLLPLGQAYLEIPGAGGGHAACKGMFSLARVE